MLVWCLNSLSDQLKLETSEPAQKKEKCNSINSFAVEIRINSSKQKDINQDMD